MILNETKLGGNKKMYQTFLIRLKSISKQGFFHIFGSSILAQVTGLLSSIIVIRRLPKIEYGYYTNANNVYSYISAFIGLGLTAAVLQFCSEKIDERKRTTIYHFTFSVGNLFNIFLMILIVIMGMILKRIGDVQSGEYLIYMCGVPFVVYWYNYFQIALRVKRKNKEHAYINGFYTIVSLLAHIGLTYLYGVVGLIYSLYISYLSSSVLACIYLQRERFFQDIYNNKEKLENSEKKGILSFSAYCAVTNFTSSLLVLLDITCLNLVLRNSEVLADYKVANIIPTACMFIPSCLITFFYPLMVERYSDSIIQFKNYLKNMIKIFAVVGVAVLVLIEVFSPFIIGIVYGEKYKNVTYIFRILGFNFLFGSFKKLFGNAIVIIKKVKINLLHTTISGILNIILNLSLIPSLGSAGAAIATVIVTIFIVGLDIMYLFRYLKRGIQSSNMMNASENGA